MSGIRAEIPPGPGPGPDPDSVPGVPSLSIADSGNGASVLQRLQLDRPAPEASGGHPDPLIRSVGIA